jgi:tetratricopeptide (TPR) repeat protein
MEDYVRAKRNIGEILSRSKSYDRAVANYDGAIETVNKMIENKKNEGKWRHYLSSLQDQRGDALRAYRKFDAALVAYHAAANAAKSSIEIDAEDRDASTDLRDAVNDITSLSRDFILAQEFDKAFVSAELANSLIPGIIGIEAQRAHALMFLERDAEALGIYRKYRDKTVFPGRTWEDYILKDFKDFEEHNLSRPLMQDIRKLLRAPE